ncbi:uncharacterized protein LOC144635721 isoform X2 [Oculina patagonica]
MSTNNSEVNITCRRQGSSEEQRESERQRARINRRRASEEDRERKRASDRDRRRNMSEERREAELAKNRERRQNMSEERREAKRARDRERRRNSSEQYRAAERARARENRQKKRKEEREKELQRQRDRQQNNNMLTEATGENESGVIQVECGMECSLPGEQKESDSGDVQQLLCDAEKLHGSEDLQRIALDAGFIISDNQGLGNCMFFALAEQLEIVKGVKISAEELRVNLVKFLKENSNLPNGTHLFRFVDHDRHPTWSDYLESMAKDGTWGDHLMLQAAANYYNTAIRVVSSLGRENESLICPVNPADSLPNTSNTNHQQPLVLGYIFELHYVSLVPRQDSVECFTQGRISEEVASEKEIEYAGPVSVASTEMSTGEHLESDNSELRNHLLSAQNSALKTQQPDPEISSSSHVEDSYLINRARAVGVAYEFAKAGSVETEDDRRKRQRRNQRRVSDEERRLREVVGDLPPPPPAGSSQLEDNAYVAIRAFEVEQMTYKFRCCDICQE